MMRVSTLFFLTIPISREGTLAQYVGRWRRHYGHWQMYFIGDYQGWLRKEEKRAVKYLDKVLDQSRIPAFRCGGIVSVFTLTSVIWRMSVQRAFAESDGRQCRLIQVSKGKSRWPRSESA
jgi:hypothetical protein